MTEPVDNGKKERDELPSWKEVLEYYSLLSDIITGPTFRLKENLYQLVIIVMGTCFGIAFTKLLFPNVKNAIIIGAYFGSILSLIVTGAYIGVSRTIYHVRSMKQNKDSK